MNYYLREGKTEDAEQKGFVHYTSWKETYIDLMPKEYLDKLKLENCINNAKKYPQNTIVAVVDNIVVGFIGYLDDSREMASVKQSSEIMAIYILKKYQKKGIGYALMQESLKRVTKSKVILFVLEGNDNAIYFYKRMGFNFTGHKIIKPVLGGELVELEMVLQR